MIYVDGLCTNITVNLCLSIRSCEISGMLGPDAARPKDSVRRSNSSCSLPTPCEEEEEKMLSALNSEHGLQSQLYFGGREWDSVLVPIFLLFSFSFFWLTSSLYRHTTEPLDLVTGHNHLESIFL